MSHSDSEHSNYFQPDSYSNAEEESPSKVPSPMQSNHKRYQNSRFLSSEKQKHRNNMYELTFKKQNLQNIFSNHQQDPETSNLKKNLFTQSASQVKKMLTIPIQDFYNANLQSLSERLIPATLIQNKSFAKNLFVVLTLDAKLSEKERFKVHLIRRIYELKIIMEKYRNSKVNLQALSSKQNKTQQQVYKQLVLNSLVGQLKKKVFLEGLKFNYYERKYFNLHLTKTEKKDQDSLDQEDQVKIQGQNPRQSRQQKVYKNRNIVKEDPRAVILVHGLRTIIQDRLHFSFKRLNMWQAHKQQKIRQDQNIQDGYQMNQDDPSNLIMDGQQNQFLNDNYNQGIDFSPQYQEQGIELHPQNSHQGLMTKQQKMAQLADAIREIQLQTKTSLRSQKGNQLRMRLAFNRWKIYCYKGIMEFIEQQAEQVQGNQPSNNQQNQQSFEEYIKQKTGELQDNYYEPSENDTSFNSRFQRQQFDFKKQDDQFQPQQNVDVQRGKSLKQQKRQLKNKIFRLRGQQFIHELHQFQSYKRIKHIVKSIHSENLLKKAFMSFAINREDNQRVAQLSEYYNQIGQEQSQNMLPSILFHNSNILTRTFFHMKLHKNVSKMFKAVNTFVKRICFDQIYSVHAYDRRQQNQFERYRELHRKFLMFKTFNVLKDKVMAPKKAIKAYQRYKKQKKHQLLGICFSALNLEVKRTKLMKRKAEKYYTCNILAKCFQKLRVFSETGLERTKKSQALFQTFNYIQKTKTLKKLRYFYNEQLNFQDLEVQTHKLSQSLLKRRIRNCLTEWRKQTIKKNTYRAIQVRLARLTQKQKVRKIFNHWYEQAGNMRHLKTQTKSSTQHKDWLKKYYEGLCEIGN